MFRPGALVLCALALSACRQTRDPYDEPYGKKTGAEMRQEWEAQRKKEASRFTDADLKAMVDRLFIQRDVNRENFHGLLYSGSRPVPYLIRALDDPRTWNTVFSRAAFDPIERSPFDRICSLLDNSSPAEAVAPMIRYLGHPDPEFRREAASVLAEIATPECVDPVKRALADPDQRVRQSVLFGLLHALQEQRRNEIFFSGVFPALLPLLKSGKYDVRGPAEVLVAIDAGKAVPILESPEYFRMENPQFRQIMTALNRDDVKVPSSILFPVLGKLERLATSDGPRALDFGAALTLYARNPDSPAEAEMRFRSLLGSPSSAVSEAAANGLEILAGINPHEAVWKVYEERGFAAMTKPQRYYLAIEEYRDEVLNGGHEQYFYNSDSDIYQIAIEGLRTVGATSKAAALTGALDAFAPMRPAVHNEERRDQMALFGGLQKGIFGGADQKFSASEDRPGERFAELLVLYALNHKSDFIRPNQSPMRSTRTPAKSE